MKCRIFVNDFTSISDTVLAFILVRSIFCYICRKRLMGPVPPPADAKENVSTEVGLTTPTGVTTF